MKLAVFLALLLVPALLQGQQTRDDLDQVRGDNPTLRYGYYTLPSGQQQAARYYFVDDGENLRVTLAQYGKPVVELPLSSFDREAGVLVLNWQDEPQRVCRLERQQGNAYLGACTDGAAPLPMTIRPMSRADHELMGLFAPPSATDVEILAAAHARFSAQQGRNLEDDRNCDDDIESGHYSLFCSLYLAQLEVTGAYMHRRPAMQTVRALLQKHYPGKYKHLLRDINNQPDISDAQLAETLLQAQATMRRTIELDRQ